jgi:hypothetical protein
MHQKTLIMGKEYLNGDSNHAVVKKNKKMQLKSTSDVGGSEEGGVHKGKGTKKSTSVIDKKKRTEELAKLCAQLEEAREQVKQQKERLMQVRGDVKSRKKKKKKKAKGSSKSVGDVSALSEDAVRRREKEQKTRSPALDNGNASLKDFLATAGEHKSPRRGRRRDKSGSQSVGALDESLSSIPGPVYSNESSLRSVIERENASISSSSLEPSKKESVRILTQSANSSASFSLTNLNTPVKKKGNISKVPSAFHMSLNNLENNAETISPVGKRSKAKKTPSAFHSSFSNYENDRIKTSPKVMPQSTPPKSFRSDGLPSIGESKTSKPLLPPMPIPFRSPREKASTPGASPPRTPTEDEHKPEIDQSSKSVKAKLKGFEAFFEQKAAGALPPSGTPASLRKPEHIPLTPRTLKNGFVTMNIASPGLMVKPKVAPPKRFFDGKSHEQDRAQTYIDAAVKMLKDKSHENEIKELVSKVNEANGFPTTRRLSMRDNELVGRFIMAIRNDPSVTSIEVTPDIFGTISSTLLAQFISSLRINLHLKSLKFVGVELGNDFLYSLADSMESNFVVEEIDLSRNLFTNAGLAEFCQSIATSNNTCRRLNLENQTTPISKASEYFVLDSFRENKTFTDVKLDFQSDEAATKLQEIIRRNQNGSPPVVDVDLKLLEVFRYEAERAQEVWDEQHDEEGNLELSSDDWGRLYKLSVLFDKRKLKAQVQEASEEFIPSTKRINGDHMSKEEKKEFLFGAFKNHLEGSVACFNSDGSFLTPEFIAKYFKEDKEEETLTFDFHGQWKLFKRFPIHDPARQLIVSKFVDALVAHPRRNEITGINMANTGCGDDFLITLAERCLGNSSLLPKLYMLNFETNFINVDGIVALANLIASPTALKFLQVVRLENQNLMLKSKAEFALARAMRANYNIVVMSLTVRNLMERQQLSKYVVRNLDFIRQARQRHFKLTGQQRERNDIEKFFDMVAENDPMIDTADLVGKKRFLTLTREEKLKAARSFAKNTHVKKINFGRCGIDDEFVIELGRSLEDNRTIEKVLLEGNNISGEGIIALFQSLTKNVSVRELRLHKQSKTLNTSDEQNLASILEPNTTLTKVGIDLRTTMAQVQLDKKLGLNRNLSLKQRAESKGGEFAPTDSRVALKF